MNKQQGTLILTALTALAATVASCDNGCEQTRENYIHVSFVSSSGRDLKKMEIIASTGEEGYMLEGINKFDDVELHLCPSDSLTYLLITATYTDFGDSFQESDTVLVRYTAQPYYLDLNCGCTVNYEITSVLSTHHLFKNVDIVDPIVLTESGINLNFDY